MLKRQLFNNSIVTILGLITVFQISQAEETKWIAVSMLHDWYSAAGSERETGRTNQISDQQDGLRWPALYSVQDCKAAKAMWIGATNFDDPILGKRLDYKVVHIGPRHIDVEQETMPVEFKLIARFDHPTVIVDGDPASDLDYMDIVDEIDESLPCDRMLYNVVNTSMGITVTRKVMAFTNPYHNNYFIYDYTFKNTGIYNKEGDRVEQTLTGVVFHFQYRYAVSREGGPYGGKGYWLPQNSSWGRNTMNDVVGEDPNSGDPFRALFSWHGKHSGVNFDNIGGPYYGGDGHLGAAQFVGVVTLHADFSPSDTSDDPYQPFTTWYIDSDASITSMNDQFNEPKMAEEYAVMTAGHPPLSQAEEVGDGFADQFGNTAGGYSQGQGFGPYTLAPGDSIHIVMAEGVSGLSREMCYIIGHNWIDDKVPLSSLTMPDGSVPTSKDEYKDAWVMTGKDSIFQTFYRAIHNYRAEYQIPQPPQPPVYFEVTSGGDRIILKWDPSPDEDKPFFKGYKIFRAIHQADTTYEEIFSCAKPDLVHEYNDFTAKRGFDYYYYIVSYDDGSNANGVILYSSLFYTKTNKPASLQRPAVDDLNQIRVVPNPYNVRAVPLQYGKGAPDRIMFLNLPGECTIRIYTERGDLIKTIEHTNGSGDEAWNLVTKYRQVVVSGIYLAHIETPDGRSTYRKFIVIR